MILDFLDSLDFLDILDDLEAQKKEFSSPECPARRTPTKTAATYSPTLRCSTIGACGLNFSVRDGKRWSPAAIAT